MKRTFVNNELHVISNGKMSLSQFVEEVTLIEPYVDYFHLREKTASAKALCRCIDHLLQEGILIDKIIVNDRVDVAVTMQVKRVQLNYQSIATKNVKRTFPELHVGKSVHSLSEAIKEEEDGADSIMFGHIYDSPSKSGVLPRGLTSLQAITEEVTIPVITIGGMRPDNIKRMFTMGATGVAVMSGIWESRDLLSTVKDYRGRMTHASTD
ncbi:thiamine phosphate synthase [Salipaludibacillus sp. LMS25]|jgi:thiazole tautomerase (transcriptional regulator TenI)|uniref:thiamine phosphate synthase n=1 Tax=Salipaludibacillus sp. LMS25 TaxID=2924031 RepID=UPI0020D066E6|nr:thiamine phosphate synthase [Salipaludibacillus sp. LMS25]UTR14302.1 thiamine phosphate synthase [Salipaludibacillus sp. LMS25]